MQLVKVFSHHLFWTLNYNLKIELVYLMDIETSFSGTCPPLFLVLLNHEKNDKNEHTSWGSFDENVSTNIVNKLTEWGWATMLRCILYFPPRHHDSKSWCRNSCQTDFASELHRSALIMTQKLKSKYFDEDSFITLGAV